MQQLLFFITKRKYFFLFIFIQLITIWLTIQNQDYHRAKFVNSTSNFVGSVYNLSNYWNKYLGLEEQNKRLLQENAKLQSMLKSSMLEVSNDFTNHSDTNNFHIVQKYNFTYADIVNNSFRSMNNYITLNKGSKNGITTGSGVITENGILGIIENVGENYSSAVSVLNKKSLVNTKLKNSHYFGSLSWPGKDRNLFLLSDIPKQANIEIGDTVTTGSFSTIFPEGINIGFINSFIIPKGQNYYEIEIKSFIDYANLKDVYIIQNLHKSDINNVENLN